jgi:copper transport protein
MPPVLPPRRARSLIWLRVIAALAGALAVFVMLPSPSASAHAALIGSDLTDGAVVAASPPTVELRFSEEVLAGATSVTLLRLGPGTTQTLGFTPTDGGKHLVVAMPPLARGAYLLRFSVVDPADLHKTVGSISFGVGVPAPSSEAGEQIVGSWPSALLRTVTDISLILTIGSVAVACAMARDHSRDVVPATRLAVVGGAVTAFGWLALVVADAASVGIGKVSWGGVLLSSDPGRRAIFGLQLAAGAWACNRLLRRSSNAAGRTVVVQILAALALGFAVAAGYGGHAAIGGSYAVGVVIRTAHVASLGVWLGAVAVTWLLGRSHPSVPVLWPRISVLASIGIAVTGATGLLLSGRMASTVTALLSTAYGRLLVAKAGTLLVLGVLGFAAARHVARGQMPRAVPAELAVAACAVVVAALLAGAAPARGERFDPLPAIEPQLATGDLADLTISASLQPARPGANLVQVRVLETRRPAPGPVTGLTMTLVGADGATVAQRSGVPADGLVEWTDLDLPNPGSYRIEVAVSRPAAPVHPFVAALAVEAPPVPRARTVVSTRAWRPLATAAAGGWVLVAAFGFGVHRKRRAVSSSGAISIEAGAVDDEPSG